MQVVHSSGNYTINVGSFEDIDVVTKMLVDQFLPADSGANMKMRRTKKYGVIGRNALNKQKVLLVKREEEVQGLCIYNDLSESAFIEYLTVCVEHRYSTASGYLLNYVLNWIFPDQEVFFKSPIDAFTTVSRKVGKHDRYILDPKVRETLAKLFKDT